MRTEVLLNPQMVGGLRKGTARGDLRCNLIRKAWVRDGRGEPVQAKEKKKGDAGKKAVWVGPAPTKTEN